ncbi:uncharacterized protein LOC130965782 [Arachis stenosperma]|uniref:uncharacterized protein LOC130965782 n=1 Tax=Arachis stenosperma TaxID=217475 RepID=UPI0025AB6BF8|nr:uncharacterized protein LOC130965782 [Arachis stenosperma]
MVRCVYKVISKVLVRRMRQVMPELVGETQSAFVKGRKIHDGVLIACETVNWLKRRKEEAAIIKWRSWVMECVTTVFMSVLINDVLHWMIGEAIRNGRILPLLVGIDSIELSHLQFADGTILFCPPEDETIKNYKRLLRCFELMSGLSINFDKSSLIPMPKVVAEKLISLQSGFLWRKEDGSNGMALVKWEVVQAPKKVVCSCNNLNPNELLSTQVLPTKGGPWKDICQLQITNQHIRDKMVTGLSMEVGDGQRTRFWEDVWLLYGSLKDRFPRFFSISNQCRSVIGDCGF